MKLERFFEKFELFAEAPDAVARMREVVLELAVRGKLVTQNDIDEPATQLLKRVLAEKNRRKGGRESSGEEKGSAPDNEAFEIPENWEWIGATTPTVIVSDQGKKVQTKEILESGKYPVVDQGKLFIRGYCDDADKVISVSEPIVLFGDHTRETKFIDFDFVVGADGVKLLQPICIDPRFYFMVLRWLPLESRGYARHFKLLKAARIPIPPLAEQNRIVAKVDELMALCDQLEAQQQDRQTRHAALVQASLANFTQDPTLANLQFLFHASYTVSPADLRKTILTLAVQGKLVPQDPKDEPAVQMLKQIEQEEQQLFNDGKIEKYKSASNLAMEEAPYKIPKEWEWVVVKSVFDTISGTTFDASKEKQNGAYAYVKVSDMNLPGNEFIITTSSRFVDPDEKMLHSLIPADSIIFPKRGGAIATNKKKVVQKPIFVDLNIMAITPKKIVLTTYAYRWLMTIDLASLNSGTSVPQINHKDINPLLFPLPPLAEQRRIVAKVDELMALVDELEGQLVASRTVAQNLLAALVRELTTTP